MNTVHNSSYIAAIVLVGGLSFSSLIIAKDLNLDIPATGPIPFATFDADNNGVISAEEYQNARDARQAKHSKSGKPHFGAKQAPSFAAIDIDNDKQITKQELATAQKMQRNNKPMQQLQQSKMTTKQATADKQLNQPKRRAMPSFSEFDLDNNGQISEQELTKARKMRQDSKQLNGKGKNQNRNRMSFAEIDTDHNGEVSPNEFKQHQMKQRLNY